MVLSLLRLAAADSMTNDSARYPEIEVFGSLLELGHVDGHVAPEPANHQHEVEQEHEHVDNGLRREQEHARR